MMMKSTMKMIMLTISMASITIIISMMMCMRMITIMMMMCMTMITTMMMIFGWVFNVNMRREKC